MSDRTCYTHAPSPTAGAFVMSRTLAVGAARLRETAEPAPPSVVCAHRSGGNTGGGSAATGEVDVTLIRITPETTRAELAEAITWAAQAAARIPEHHTEQKARAHERVNVLLDELESRPA